MRGDRAPNRRNRVGAWRKPGGQPPAERHAAGRPATDRIVAVTINVDSLRGKVGCVLRAIDDLARRVGARVAVLVLAVLVLEETKLEPGVEIQIPGFYPASRRDRDRHGGGVANFVDCAYVAFESYKGRRVPDGRARRRGGRSLRVHGCEEKGRDEAPLLQQSQRTGRVIVMLNRLNLTSANSGAQAQASYVAGGPPYPLA